MAYGPIYEFAFDSQNGADILIVISKKNYTGEVTRRPLGRAPILKRENNGHVYGTSLEIYAECKVDGEYAEFYTSSADEFKVNVYKDQIPIWTGFITPELYSEPDIAPPYDVQIIATDGLGELKNYTFDSVNASSLHDHFANLLNHTGLSLEIAMVSALKYYNGESASLPQDLLDIRLDLSHENGSSCYDVLQHMLSALNASISQFDDKWFIFRETDFIHLASEQGLDAFKPGENPHKLEINSFGSAASAEWWPIGQMSTSIEPAKNRLNLTSPNHYKGNVLGSSWAMENGASYDETEGAYVLPDEGSYIVQKLDFGGDRVEYRLALRISARNVGSGEEDQPLGIRVVIDGRSYSGERQYWLVQSASSDRGVGAYLWKTSEGEIEAELAVPSDSDTAADAQDVDIILPLYRNGNRSYVGATSVEVTVFNPAGIHDIYVYGASLSKYDQFEGYQADVVLENGAREEASSVDLTILDGAKAPEGSVVFMSGIPLLPGANTSITAWGIGSSASEDYLSLMSKDYSKEVALPRMSYRGTMNVPRGTMPVLFVRDNTYYFPRTYSYNLLDDELEVDLISIPAAEVTVSSIVVSQMTQSEGSFSSGGSGGGGGIGTGIDLSGYAKKEELTTLSELLASMWALDEAGNLVTTKQVIIKNNLVVHGDSSSGGEGSITPGGGGIVGIKVNGTTFYDTNSDGIIDLGTISGGGGLTSVSWADIADRPTALSEFENDLSSSDIAEILGYTPVRPATLNNFLPKTGGQLTGALQIFDHMIYDDDGAFSIDSMDTISLYAPNDIVIWSEEGQLYFNDKPVLTEHQSLAGYQPLITDLGTIRSGAALGATAVQPATLNNYATNTALSNGLATKQNTISDLATIRSGAALGASAVQPATLTSALAGYLPLSGGTLNGALTVNGAISGASTIQANSIICGTTRLRVNATGSVTSFGFIDAVLYGSTNNRSTVHIGSCYGGSSTITNTAEYPSGVSMTAISMYRGSVGIGKRFSDSELDTAYKAGIMLTVAGSQTIDGNLVVNGDIASA